MTSYQATFTVKRLWVILGSGMIVMFGILLFMGREIYQQAPPIRIDLGARQLSCSRLEC